MQTQLSATQPAEFTARGANGFSAMLDAVFPSPDFRRRPGHNAGSSTSSTIARDLAEACS